MMIELDYRWVRVNLGTYVTRLSRNFRLCPGIQISNNLCGIRSHVLCDVKISFTHSEFDYGYRKPESGQKPLLGDFTTNV